MIRTRAKIPICLLVLLVSTKSFAFLATSNGHQVGAIRHHVPHGARVARSRRRLTASSTDAPKDLDLDAVVKYGSAVGLQMAAITGVLGTCDAALDATGFTDSLPWPIVFAAFVGLSLKSRVFSPLDNQRPDLTKAVAGESTGGFNDRVMPGWTPPGIVFPIMWVLIVAPLRASASTLLFLGNGHVLCCPAILSLMLHLSVGDTWNTVNNVERRLGAAVPGVALVWCTVLFAVSQFLSSEVPLAGRVLAPTAVWITVAGLLIADTWRVNNADGNEPLYPYKSDVTKTRFWFETKE